MRITMLDSVSLLAIPHSVGAEPESFTDLMTPGVGDWPRIAIPAFLSRSATVVR
jgi:hypothetical protein